MAAPAQHAPEPERLYRIGDVSRITNTKPFVLRFWETEFPMLQPVKAPKGHRLYRQQDIDLIQAIKRLLYEEGFTIPGARRHLAEAMANPDGRASLGAGSQSLPFPPETTGRDVDGRDTTCRALTPPTRPQHEGWENEQAPDTTPDDVRGTLLAVRRELLAILTLLGTR